MAYVALYRKYRPQNLSEVVGQQAIKQALGNAFAQNRIVHAYLFSGPRGTGKTSIAKIFAKTVNCEHRPQPDIACNECSNCLDITKGGSMDVFEIDAASNRGIDQIRELRENVQYSPGSCRYKVYIIDEAHMLTGEAFNALLKTLEEPPAHVIFILATTEANKIPITIQSRCQRYDFRKLSLEDLAARIEFVAADSGLEIIPEAVNMIALQADGALRDALSLLEQAAIVQNPITGDSLRLMLGNLHIEDLREFIIALAKYDLPASLTLLNKLVEQGKEAHVIIQELIAYLRGLIIYKACPQTLHTQMKDTTEQLQTMSALYQAEQLVEIVEVLGQSLQEMRFATKPTLVAELTLIKICHRPPAVQTVYVPQPTVEHRAPRKITSTVAVEHKETVQTIQKLDSKNLLHALTEQLAKDRERMVIACLDPRFVSVHSCNSEQLTLVVNKKFALDRLLQADYTSLIERTLHKMYGMDMRFSAIDEQQAAITVTEKPKEELVPVPPEEVENLGDAVQQAQKMFGGTVNIVK